MSLAPPEVEECDRNPGEFHIDRLPFEVLAHIFQCFVNSDEGKDLFTYPKGAFPLGAVSRTWRDIAWTTPSLWTSLIFKSGKKTTENHVQLAIDWLARSGELPLSVSLSDSALKETIMLPLIDVVNQLLYRCHTLLLHDFTTLTHSYFHPAPRPSILQVLRIIPHTLISTFNLGLHVSPKELCIYEFRLAFLVIDWNNLTQFDAFGLYFDEIFRAITLAPRLVTCDQFDVKDDMGRPLPLESGPITHSLLSELMICMICQCYDDQPERHLATFFQQVSLPNLTKCHITAVEYPFPSITFLTFLTRSSCSIEELYVVSENIRGEDFIEIAKACPSLTSLTLLLVEGSSLEQPLDPFYNALCQGSRYSLNTNTTQSSSGILVPLLRHLEIVTNLSFPWRLIPGLLFEYSQYEDGERIVSLRRLNLKTVRISMRYEVSTNDMIDSWELFSDLLELRDHINLCLEINDNDLFELSYQYLQNNINVRQFVSKQIDQFAERMGSSVNAGYGG